MSKLTDEILTNTNLASQSIAKKQTDTHIDILDGFRGLAILLVMWFHIWQQSWLGAEIKIFGLNLNFDFIPPQVSHNTVAKVKIIIADLIHQVQ
jgi:hypothetical protein